MIERIPDLRAFDSGIAKEQRVCARIGVFVGCQR